MESPSQIMLQKVGFMVDGTLLFFKVPLVGTPNTE
jgi:hypothetical protein